MIPFRRLSLSAVLLLATALPGAPLSGQDVGGDPSVLELLPVADRALSAGGAATGSLTRSDFRLEDGKRAQAWAVRIDVAATLRFDISSEDFDAYLFLFGPDLGRGVENDDGGDGLDARVCIDLAPGDYRLVAASLGGETGAFDLAVRVVDAANPGCEDGMSTGRVDADVGDIPSVGALDDGESVTSTLEEAWWWDERPTQVWDWTPTASGTWTLDLSSDDFDTWMAFVGPDGSVELEDDDGGCGTGSRLVVDVVAGESVRVVVSSYFGSTGEYALRMVSDASTLPECDDDFEWEDEAVLDSAALEGIPVVGRVSIGDTRDGILDEFSYWVAERSSDIWTLDGVAGARIAIVVEAEFDPMVALLGPGLPWTLENDDDGESLNSRLCTILPETGEYRVVVRGFDAEPEGPYVLRIESDPPAGSCTLQVPPDLEDDVRAAFQAEALAAARVTVESGRSAEGTLDGSESLRDPIDGRGLVAVRATLRAGERATFDLQGAFDSWMEVLGPDGSSWTDDDGGCGRMSRVTIEDAEAGDYVVLVGRLFEPEVEASDAWTLVLAEDGAPCTHGVEDLEPAGTLGIGQSRTSRLHADLPRSDRDSPFELWTVDLEEQGRLVVDLSADFDTYLHVLSPDGEREWTNDDFCSLDSRIVIEDAEPGRWRILASALLDPESGGEPYVIAVSDRERPCGSIVKPGGGASAPQPAGSGAR